MDRLCGRNVEASTGLIDPQYGVNGTAPMIEIYALLAGSSPTPYCAATTRSPRGDPGRHWVAAIRPIDMAKAVDYSPDAPATKPQGPRT